MMTRAPAHGFGAAAKRVVPALAVVAVAMALSEGRFNVLASGLDRTRWLVLWLRPFRAAGDTQRRAVCWLEGRAAQRDEKGIVPTLEVGLAQHADRGLPPLQPLGMRHIERLMEAA